MLFATLSQLFGQPGWLMLGVFLAGLTAGIFGLSRTRPYFAHAEYWVYLPTEELPSQEQIMHRMLRGNP
ncbi:MAG: hypothetical protein QOJ65_1914, partial [Fimbriimonadaceae bacterium]|nr:hypothetical protein [Fimbriimonadaceae bacterium]